MKKKYTPFFVVVNMQQKYKKKGEGCFETIKKDKSCD